MTALFLRDIKLSLRAGGGFGLALGFFLILVVFIPFGVGTDTQILGAIAGGVLWIGALLSNLLSLDRMFSMDAEDGALDALLTAPIPAPMIVLCKTIAHWVCTGLPLCVASVPLGYMLGLPMGGYWALFIGLLVGTPALSFIGSFGAALTLGVKRGGLLLSIIVLPLYIPTLIFGGLSLRAALGGLEYGGALAFLAGISLACAGILPFMTAMCLRLDND